MKETKWKTVIVSDLHLGSKASRSEDLWHFLNDNPSQTLILNGDIVDEWAMRRGAKWQDKHSKVIRKILKIAEKGANVIWIRGNHDDFLKDFLPFALGNVSLQEDYMFQSLNGKKLYVFHGDVLDVFILKMKWVAHLGAVGYDLALWLNRVYNEYRRWRGLPYYSISRHIKNSVKQAVDFINDFENNAVRLARAKGADIAVCGHIHQPFLGPAYMNSGDWCENCTALAEGFDGDWKVLEFHPGQARREEILDM
jgi:UDP-2,3-diacylglucosamine pyrophosphatase LpxH